MAWYGRVGWRLSWERHLSSTGSAKPGIPGQTQSFPKKSMLPKNSRFLKLVYLAIPKTTFLLILFADLGIDFWLRTSVWENIQACDPCFASFIKMLTGSIPLIYHNLSLFPTGVPEILGISHWCCFLCLLDGLSFFVRKEKVGTYLETGWSFACLGLSNDQPDPGPETGFQKVILRWISEMCSSLISIFKNHVREA